MSASIPRTPTVPNWFARALERDYCPGLDPYIAWLRQPVGWFALATAACTLVGVTIAPLALSLAAGLLALLTIGLAYPFLATRLTTCEIISIRRELSEDEAHPVELRLRNRCPWPLWGLLIEGFVVTPLEAEHESSAEPDADIALGVVPWLSQVTYRLTLHPNMRGRYPLQVPQLTCAFPFGLWTARRPVAQITPVIVRPKQVKIVGLAEQAGRQAAHFGTGTRSGGQDEFLGLREYRIGDSIRHIHWAHTARMDSIVVCERSAPEQSTWQIRLNTSNLCPGTRAGRDNLAWRVRIAASLCSWLHQQSVNFSLRIEGEATASHRTIERNRLEDALDRLTDVPLDGFVDAAASECMSPVGAPVECTISIEPVCEADSASGENQLSHWVRLRWQRSSGDWRRAHAVSEGLIDLNQPIAAQIIAWLQRGQHGLQAA